MIGAPPKLVHAIEAVLDIAYNGGGRPVQSRDIGERQGIQPRYLEPVLQALHDAGVEARAVWRPMHQLGIHDGVIATSLEVTERLAQTTINLPSSPDLGGLHFDR